MDYRHVFATNLRRIRHEKGFSQEVLAYEANVNRTYMSKLEKGGSFVGLEVMVRLASVLDVEPAEFLKPTSRKASRSPKGARKR